MKRPGLKSGSKRHTLHHQYKVKKKVLEHNRKQRKLAKNGKPLAPGSRFTNRTRDPGIPTDCPFRDEILAEAQKYKAHKEVEAVEKKEMQRRWQKLSNQRKTQGFSSVEEMLEAAEAKKLAFEEKERETVDESVGRGGTDNGTLTKGNRESQNFWRQVNSVIDEADIILHVLDARDPEGTRCKKIEQAVLNRGDKKLVLILNKIDLIPESAAKAWLKFYRRSVGPCLAFRASTQKQKENISQKTSAGKLDSQFAGTRAICSYLANYGRKKSADGTSKIRTAVTVGIVGKPNVGKSSIINTLKRNRSCQVGAKPGVTRSLQHVLVDTNVKLIDSPGVILKDETNASAVGQILLNAKEIGSVEDARQAAYEIIARCDDMEKMAFHYQLEISDKIINNNPDNFLAALAIRKGALRKGGKPDINRACRFLVREWTIGNLSFHTMPPVAEGKIADSIQTEMSEELDLDAMFIGKDLSEMDDGSKQAGMTVLFKNSGTEGTSVVKIEKARKVKKRKSDYENEEEDDMEDDEVPQDLKHLELPADHGKDLSNASSGKDMQKLQKKRRKQLKKSRVVANEVADKMLEEMNFEDM